MRIVIKIGTSTITHPTGRLNIRQMEALCKVLSDLKNAGNEVILVSSGAIGMGVGKLRLGKKPVDVPTKQASAAVGQCELMYTYDKLFSEYRHTVAQILLTADDIADPARHENFQNTIQRLLELDAIPIINENDTVSVAEFGIGDNDTLSAIVATSVRADLLVLLSDIDGLYTADPHKNPDAQRIRRAGDHRRHPPPGRGQGLRARDRRDEDEALRCTDRHEGGHGYDHRQRGGCGAAVRTARRPRHRHQIYRKEGRRMTTHELLLAAKAAAPALAWLGSEEKNAAILRMADAIVRETDVILAANEADVQAAKGTISDVMLDRLRLTQARIAAMADGMRQVSALPDPAGEVLAEVRRPNGLVICKTAVPLGVVAIIYESRPNVTSDAAVLAMKSGNVCVLRGGKEAYRSAAAIVAAMHEGLREAGLPETFVNLVSDPTRRSAQELMTASGLIDLLIPRGGAGLIRACVESATVPCIETGTGICHVYVDKDADLEKALNIIENAKTSRPSVCNAEEVALVHRDVAGAFLPRLKARLVDARAAAGKIPVELRLDAAAQAIIPGTPAGERDFDTEFLDYILAVKVVSDADEAIRHIAAHSTHHSDAIVTENAQTAERFTRLVDSAAVYVNASTRFTDGGEFGLGCEMGISTQKLHARGPMGLRELTTYKYIVTGDGQTR